MAAKEGLDDEVTLKAKFDNAWKLQREVESSDEPSNSLGFQNKLDEAISLFVEATRMVNTLHLFSTNEELGDVTTENLRYFLLPAFLGDLSIRKISEDRCSVVENSKIYFADFLERCKCYGIIKEDISRYIESPDKENTGQRNLSQMNQDRQAKVKRFKETKEIKSKIELQQSRTRGGEEYMLLIQKLELRLKQVPDSVDEEIQREYILSWIRVWINETFEQLSSINSELEILEHMKHIKDGKVKAPVEKPRSRPPIKPILITKDSIKSKVFGAGYRSLPTMSDEEYFQKELAEGKILLDYETQKEKEQKEKEKNQTPDDEEEESLQKARKWDEWKDEHRRGEGNRKDRG